MREATGRKESGNDPGTFSSGLDSTCWGRWCCRCRWFDGSCRGSLTGSLTGSSWTGQRILKDSWRDLCGLITGFWRIPDRIFGSLRILIILILFLDHCEPICKDPSTALRNQDPSNPVQSNPVKWRPWRRILRGSFEHGPNIRPSEGNGNGTKKRKEVTLWRDKWPIDFWWRSKRQDRSNQRSISSNVN